MTREQTAGTDATSIAEEQLLSIVSRIERLHEDRKAIADDIAEVFGEAKANGYDVPILRKIIAERRKPADERAEAEAILELYRDALARAEAPRAPAHTRVRAA